MNTFDHKAYYLLHNVSHKNIIKPREAKLAKNYKRVEDN